MKGKSKRPSAKNNTVSQNTISAPSVKEEPAEEIVMQFGENEVSVSAISDKVKQNYKECGNESELKDIKISIKPEDNKAYYVINGDIEGNVDLVSD